MAIAQLQQGSIYPAWLPPGPKLTDVEYPLQGNLEPSNALLLRPLLLPMLAALQMLSFPLSMSKNLPWLENDSMQAIMRVLSPIMISPSTEWTIDSLYTPADRLYYCASAFLICLWGGFVWAAWCHIQPPPSPARAAMAGMPVAYEGSGGAGSRASAIFGGRIPSPESGSGSGTFHYAYGGNRSPHVSTSTPSSRGSGNPSYSAGVSSSYDGDAFLEAMRAARERMEAADGLRIPYWALRFLRSLALLGVHALFVPITTTLLSPFVCSGSEVWGMAGPGSTFQCFQGPHIGFLASSVVLLPLWIGWSIVIAACMINRVPDLTGKRNLLCASHGRVFAFMIVLKAFLSGLYVFSDSLDAWAYTVVMLASSLLYGAAYWQYLPYFNQSLNQAQVAIAAIMADAAVGLVLAQSLSESLTSHGATVFVALLLPTVYAGIALARTRFSSFGRKVELSSPFAVELRMRYLLSDLIASIGHAHDAAAAIGRSAERPVEIQSDSELPPGGVGASIRTGYQIRRGNRRASMTAAGTARLANASATHTTMSATDAHAGLAASRSSASAFGSGYHGATNGSVLTGQHGYTDAAAAEDEQSRWYPNQAQNRRSEAATLLRHKDADVLVAQFLHTIEILFRDAASVFASSAILQLFRAHFHGCYKRNEHMERAFLSLSELRADQLSIDVHFFVYQRRIQIETENLMVSTRAITVDRRMQYERLVQLSRVQVSDTRLSVHSFWSELASKHPDLQRVQAIGTAINKGIAEAQESFRELLILAPQSASVIRQYADFLLELANDPTRGMELLADAEQMEDEHSKHHSAAADDVEDVLFGAFCSEFDLSSESIAWVKISADPGRVGVIVDANSSALKLWGYDKRAMLGRDMSFLLPEPIASVHARYLERYETTGEERVVNRCRFMFAQHRNGYIVPVKLNVRPQHNTLTGVLEEVRTSQAFLIFVGEQDGWKVTSACKTACASLRIEPHQVKSGVIRMTQFFPSVQALHTAVTSLAATDEAVSVNLGNVRATARLQVAHLPMVPGPLYILRFRVAGYAAVVTAGGDSNGGHPSGSLAINARGGSGGTRDTGDAEGVDDVDGDAASDRVMDRAGDDAVNHGAKRIGATLQGGDIDLMASTGKPAFGVTFSSSTRTLLSATGDNLGGANAAPVQSSKIALAPLPRVLASHAAGNGADMSLCPVMGPGAARYANAGGVSASMSPSSTRLPPITAIAAAATGRPYGNTLPGQISSPAAVLHDHDRLTHYGGSRPSSASPHTPAGTGGGFRPGQWSVAGGAPPVHAVVDAVTRDGPGTAASAAESVLFADVQKRIPPASPPSSILRGSQQHSMQLLQLEATGGGAPRGVGSASGWRTSSSRASGDARASDAAPRVGFAPGAGGTPPDSGTPDDADDASAVATEPAQGAGKVDHDQQRGDNQRETSQPLHISSIHNRTRPLQFHHADSVGDGTALYQLPHAAAAEHQRQRPSYHHSDSATPGGPESFGLGAGWPTSPSKLAQQSPKPGSVYSRGSGGASSSNSHTDVLRRGVIARSKRMERSLILLKYAIIVVFGTIAALSIISICISITLFQQLQSNIDLVIRNGDRALYANRAIGHLQHLIFSTEGKFNIPEGTAYVQGKLNTWAANVESLHRGLLLAVDGTFPEEQSLYTDNVIQIDDLVAGTYVDRVHFNSTSRLIGLADAGLEFVSKIRLSNALGAGNFSLDKSSVWYVMHNGVSALGGALNTSLTLADDRSRTQVTDVQLANMAVLIVAEAVLCLIIVLIMVPAVNSVMHSKRAIFDVFLDVPLAITRALRNETQKRIEAEERADNEEDDQAGVDNVLMDAAIGMGMNSGGGGNYDSDRDAHGIAISAANGFEAGRGGIGGKLNAIVAAALESGNNSRAVTSESAISAGGFGSRGRSSSNVDAAMIVANAEEDYEDDTSCLARLHTCWRSCTSCGRALSQVANGGTLSGSGRSLHTGGALKANHAHSHVKRRRRTYRNTSTSRFWLIVQMVWPLALYVIYFAALYSYRYDTAARVEYEKDEILWTKQVSRSSSCCRDVTAEWRQQGSTEALLALLES